MKEVISFDATKPYFVKVNGDVYDIRFNLTYAGTESTTRPTLSHPQKVSVLQAFKSQFPEQAKSYVENKYWYKSVADEVEGHVEPKTTSMVTSDEVTAALNNAKSTSTNTVVSNDVLISKLDAQNKALNSSLDNFSKVVADKLGQLAERTSFEEKMLQGIISASQKEVSQKALEMLSKQIDDYVTQTYGNLPKSYTIQVNDEPVHTGKGVTHYMFEDILKLVKIGLPVMLTGGAGAGKNHTLLQISEALGLSFYYTSSITQEYKLTGFIDGAGKFHETEFFKAFTQGGVFMLDEIDASIPECLVILNGAIANGYFDFPTGREIAHEDFRVVCAGNTVGLGADMVYTGRNVIDGATLDRFILVHFGYDSNVEQTLCPDKDLYNFIKDFRQAVQKAGIQHIVGMRAMKNAQIMLNNGFEKAFIVKTVLLKGLGTDDIKVVKSKLKVKGEWYECIK